MKERSSTKDILTGIGALALLVGLVTGLVWVFTDNSRSGTFACATAFIGMISLICTVYLDD